ncbi:MFS transporter [Pseudomonas syringae]|uniref:MFS transporter n=1 Tax=Pseudomonas syringae TaxID=317 RepID=UPI0006E5B605|nr:MFS transporter [Pseudomonas syringae]KPY45374.1 Alpha-ketoglutarate permease [Pseudomonas syringae pv. rhaphiolepidis]KWS45729.1 alpha-ketoglutarate transporter [Pseudomonas syringae pv. rhaphiolepidis]
MTANKVSGSSNVAPASTVIERSGLPPSLIWGFIGLLLFMIGDGVESGFIAPFMTEKLGSMHQAAIAITLYGFTVTLGSWLAGALSDVWGPRRVMLLGLTIWVVFEVLFLGWAVPSQDFELMMAFYGLRGFGYPFFAYGFLVWVLSATEARRLGSAVGWFYFAFTGGLPTLGSLFASASQPLIGEYATLWISLGLLITGGIAALVGLRGKAGGDRLAPEGVTAVQSIVASFTIAFSNPKIGLGCLIRVVNTAPQFGFLVFLPTIFGEELGFGTAGWLKLVFTLGAANIFANLFFGVLSDKLGWHFTLRWFGCLGCAVSTLSLYYLPHYFPGQYWIAVSCAAFYGVALAGFTPISVLMSLIAPEQKGNAIAVLNLGAGAATFVGPLVVAVFMSSIGAGGVTVIFAGMYVLAGLSVRWLTIPQESRVAVENGKTLQELADPI